MRREQSIHPKSRAFFRKAIACIALGILLLSMSSSIAQESVNHSRTSDIIADKKTDNNTKEPIQEERHDPIKAPKLNVAALVTKALDFKNSLSPSQKAQLEQSYSGYLARKWSHLPCGSSCRNGVALQDLDTNQRAAALELISMVLSTDSINGYGEFEAINAAEDYLHDTVGGNTYGSGLRWIAFLNAPSNNDAWMMQIGGNHFSANFAFRNGHVIGVTPYFTSVEPHSWTYGGISYHPMEDELNGLREMLSALSSQQFGMARHPLRYIDVRMSPGESNFNFNTFDGGEGLPCYLLSDTQKTLVLAAISNFTGDVDPDVAAVMLQRYESELDSSFIFYTGTGFPGFPGSFLNANMTYVHITGPSLWIELSVQEGHEFPSQPHYHTVWRDRRSDYGDDLTGSYIDEVTAIRNQSISEIKIFPNPAGDYLQISSPSDLGGATIIIHDIAGRELIRHTLHSTDQRFDISELQPGIYTTTMVIEGESITQKFVKL